MDRCDVNRISLRGDMSMVGVTEQFPLMAQFLAEPAAVPTDQQRPHEIDLTGVHTIDACGCQLLSAFIHNIRKRGAEVFTFKLTDDCRDKIHTLGFDNELYTGGTV